MMGCRLAGRPRTRAKGRHRGRPGQERARTREVVALSGADRGRDLAARPSSRGLSGRSGISRAALDRSSGPRTPAGPDLVLHGRRGRVPRLDHRARDPARRAGGAIHSDIERGFIRAEVTPTTTCWTRAPGPAAATRARSGSRARSISSRTATSSTSASTSRLRLHAPSCRGSTSELVDEGQSRGLHEVREVDSEIDLEVFEGNPETQCEVHVTLASGQHGQFQWIFTFDRANGMVRVAPDPSPEPPAAGSIDGRRTRHRGAAHRHRPAGRFLYR